MTNPQGAQPPRDPREVHRRAGNRASANRVQARKEYEKCGLPVPERFGRRPFGGERADKYTTEEYLRESEAARQERNFLDQTARPLGYDTPEQRHNLQLAMTLWENIQQELQELQETQETRADKQQFQKDLADTQQFQKNLQGIVSLVALSRSHNQRITAEHEAAAALEMLSGRSLPNQSTEQPITAEHEAATAQASVTARRSIIREQREEKAATRLTQQGLGLGQSR
jgi:hypothetical protein